MLKCQECEGFTLVEVLVASAIMMSVFFVVFQMFSSSLWQMQRAEKASRFILVQKELVVNLSVTNFQHKKAGKGKLEGLVFSWKVTKEVRHKVDMEIYVLYNVMVELSLGKRKEIFSLHQVRKML